MPICCSVSFFAILFFVIGSSVVAQLVEDDDVVELIVCDDFEHGSLQSGWDQEGPAGASIVGGEVVCDSVDPCSLQFIQAVYSPDDRRVQVDVSMAYTSGSKPSIGIYMGLSGMSDLYEDPNAVLVLLTDLTSIALIDDLNDFSTASSVSLNINEADLLDTSFRMRVELQDDGRVVATLSNFASGGEAGNTLSYTVGYVDLATLAAMGHETGVFLYDDENYLAIDNFAHSGCTVTQPPTAFPTESPTVGPSYSPSAEPSQALSGIPSASPTRSPSHTPSYSPSATPSGSPSRIRTLRPTTHPSVTPSESPSSHSPSIGPSDGPSQSPTRNPTVRPSRDPTSFPSNTPVASTVGATVAECSMALFVLDKLNGVSLRYDRSDLIHVMLSELVMNKLGQDHGVMVGCAEQAFGPNASIVLRDRSG